MERAAAAPPPPPCSPAAHSSHMGSSHRRHLHQHTSPLRRRPVLTPMHMGHSAEDTPLLATDTDLHVRETVGDPDVAIPVETVPATLEDETDPSRGWQTSNRLDLDNDWTEMVLRYVTNVASTCKKKRKIHDASSNWYQSRFAMVTIFSILLSAAITAISQLPLEGPNFKYAVGILALLSTTVAAIIKFIGYERYQTRHHLTSQLFLELRESIQVQLCMDPMYRQNGYVYMLYISKTYRSILSQAPPPPNQVLRNLKTNDPDPDTEIPSPAPLKRSLSSDIIHPASLDGNNPPPDAAPPKSILKKPLAPHHRGDSVSVSAAMTGPDMIPSRGQPGGSIGPGEGTGSRNSPTHPQGSIPPQAPQSQTQTHTSSSSSSSSETKRD